MRTCPCGVPRRSGGHNCRACHAAYLRAWRAVHGQTDEQRRRSNARSYLHVYISRGKIQRGPCAVCGEANVLARIRDYARPLEVTWLCKRHHRPPMLRRL